MVSRVGTSRPSPNVRAFAGSRAGRPSLVSGTPTSPAETTGGQRRQRLGDLGAEHPGAHLFRHAHQRPEHRGEFRWQSCR